MTPTRFRFLAKLARRNALRHKGQTLRAILGLLVVTVILTLGLGLGESASTAFQRATLEMYGPIDVTLSAQEPIDQALVEALPAQTGLQGFDGAATLILQGAVSNPRTGLAEPAATLRGVSPHEAIALGPLRLADSSGTAPEPRADAVVLSHQLARILDARPGDTLVLRTQLRPDKPADTIQTFDHSGIAGLPESTAEHTLQIPPRTTDLHIEIELTGNIGTVQAVLRDPTGIEHRNTTTGMLLRLDAPGPVASGVWTIALTASAPTNYSAHSQLTQNVPPAPQTATIERTVLAIAKTEGRTAITGRPTVLLALDNLQEAAGVPDKVNAAYYHTAGDARHAAEALASALPAGSEDEVKVRADKADALATAKEDGVILGAIVITMGSFTLVAAILLAYTLFSALVEARRSEIGIARVLGLSHREVALTMTLEGGMYGLAAAIIGAAIGLALLALLAGAAGGLFLDGDPYGPAMALAVSPGTILLAVLIGTLIPLVTIGLASLRLARIDPAQALRGIPDDPQERRRLTLVLAGLLVAAGILLSILHDTRPLGIPLAVAGLALVAAGLRRPLLGHLLVALGIAYLVWSLYTYDYHEEEFEPVIVFAGGALLAVALSVLAVASTRPYRLLLRLLGGARGIRTSVFVGIRYLIARRRPVGLTMSMIALVTLVITVMGMLVVTAADAGKTDEAGYQIIGESSTGQVEFTRPLPADVAPDIERVDFLLEHRVFQTSQVLREGQPLEAAEQFFLFTGVTGSFASANRFSLDEGLGQRAAAYDSDEAAWSAVVAGEGIIVPWWFLESDRLHLGETVTLQVDDHGPKEYVVVAGLQSDRLSSRTFIAQEDLLAMGPPQTTKILVRTHEDADPTRVAHRLSALFAEDGMGFQSIEEEVAQDRAAAQLGILIMEGFLAFGLFVGLSSTGFMASRAVHERRRDIGTLRALGYEVSHIRHVFLIESLLTAAVGLLVGATAGLTVAHGIWWRALRAYGHGFQPPWLILAGIALAVLAIAALSTVGPARRAARLPPATAVKHVE